MFKTHTVTIHLGYMRLHRSTKIHSIGMARKVKKYVWNKQYRAEQNTYTNKNKNNQTFQSTQSRARKILCEESIAFWAALSSIARQAAVDCWTALALFVNISLLKLVVWVIIFQRPSGPSRKPSSNSDIKSWYSILVPELLPKN